MVVGLGLNIIGLYLMVKSAESEPSKDGTGQKWFNLHKINETKFRIGFSLVIIGLFFQIIGTIFS
jgi:hypothetical protein